MAKTMPTQRPGRSVQDVRTPREFLAATRALLGIDAFTVDLAATRENTVAPKFYSIRSNSLVQPWHNHEGWLFCNPPFSKIEPWVEKAAEEAARGAQIAMLLPAAIGSNWFRDQVHGAVCVLLLNGRIRFLGHTTGYPKDLMLLVYAKHWAPSYRVWDWQPPTRRRPAGTLSDAARALRDVHAARIKGEQDPSRHLLHLDETTLRCLANGDVTATCQMKAREYVALIEAHTLGRPHELPVEAIA